MSRYKIIFSGRVQRVGFRFFVQKCADVHGLTGYVFNLADGRVEAEAQGTDEQIAAFLARIMVGNGICKVREYSQDEIALQMEENSFTIR